MSPRRKPGAPPLKSEWAVTETPRTLQDKLRYTFAPGGTLVAHHDTRTIRYMSAVRYCSCGLVFAPTARHNLCDTCAGRET
jgi:hypothetical protein